MGDEFREELRRLINRFSKENGSNTPDYLLAEFLCGCLSLHDTAVRDREQWYGHTSAPASGSITVARADLSRKVEAAISHWWIDCLRSDPFSEVSLRDARYRMVLLGDLRNLILREFGCDVETPESRHRAMRPETT